MFRGRSRIFFRRGCARLVSCPSSTPVNHVFFLQNTSCIRKPQAISGGGVHTPCTFPLDPPLLLGFIRSLSNLMGSWLYKIIFVLSIVISTIRESGTGEKVTHGCTIFFFERCIQTFCLKLNCSVSRQNPRGVREHDLSPSCPRELTREIFLCHTDTVDSL